MATKKKVTKKVATKKVVEAPKSKPDGITNKGGIYTYLCDCGDVTMTSINLDKLKRQVTKIQCKC